MDQALNLWLFFLIFASVLIAAWLILRSRIMSDQGSKVKEWLIYACLKAESKFGGETGKIKLRFVYDMFIAKFPWVSRVITFAEFELLVDCALEEMKLILGTNSRVAELVEKGEF